ncbi:hypothetical protein M8494_28070 [Serratia ureilytica]
MLTAKRCSAAGSRFRSAALRPGGAQRRRQNPVAAPDRRAGSAGQRHVESHAALAYVAQQPEIAADTTLAQLLGYGEVFAALARIEQGRPLAADIDRLEGRWDLNDRLQSAFAAAGLPASIRCDPHAT